MGGWTKTRPGSLGLLPSGPDPVGERYVLRQPPASYLDYARPRRKGGGASRATGPGGGEGNFRGFKEFKAIEDGKFPRRRSQRRACRISISIHCIYVIYSRVEEKRTSAPSAGPREARFYGDANRPMPAPASDAGAPARDDPSRAAAQPRPARRRNSQSRRPLVSATGRSPPRFGIGEFVSCRRNTVTVMLRGPKSLGRYNSDVWPRVDAKSQGFTDGWAPILDKKAFKGEDVLVAVIIG